MTPGLVPRTTLFTARIQGFPRGLFTTRIRGFPKDTMSGGPRKEQQKMFAFLGGTSTGVDDGRLGVVDESAISSEYTNNPYVELFPLE